MPSEEQLERAMQENQQQMKALHGLCDRPKYWSELSIDEKIERCREQIKTCQLQNEEILDALNRISSAQSSLWNHRHNMPAGEVLLPVGSTPPCEPNRYYGDHTLRQTGKGENPNEVYF